MIYYCYEILEVNYPLSVSNTEETKVTISSSQLICIVPMTGVCFIDKTLHWTHIKEKSPTLLQRSFILLP